MKTKTFKKLYHIGLLEGRENRCKDSQEGHCLSVSEHPEAWLTICKLGGYPLWELTKPQNTFLHAVALKKKERALIDQWALQEGYVVQGTRYRAWSTDEDGEPTYISFKTRKEAEVEAGADRASYDAENTVLNVDEVPALIATAKLETYCEMRVEFSDVDMALLLCYADNVLQLDGVFWNDPVEPYLGFGHAPRAGIFPHKVAEWTIRKVRDRY